jgi:HEAT repeat protein
MDAMGAYDMRVSWHAAAKVRRLYGRDGLLEAIKHPNPYTRANASHTLMHYGGAEVERALIVAASDTDRHVRMWVAWSLGEQGTMAALPTLERLTADSAEIVRLKAAEAAEKVKRRSGILAPPEDAARAGAAQQ